MCSALELVKARRRIKELEAQLAPPPLPIIRSEIGIAKLRELLELNFPSAQIFLSDSLKYLCDIMDINAFLTQDRTNRIRYRKERFDCDDFAFRLMGQFSVPGWAEIAKGIVWTDRHALLGCVDTNRDFWFIEPQDNSIFSELKPWQGTRVRLVII